MPIGGPDRYFISNFNTQVLLDWIREVRDEIVALNTPTSVIDGQIAALVINTRLRTFGYYALNRHEQGILDNKFKAEQSKMPIIAKTYQEESIKEINENSVTVNGKKVSKAYVKNAEIYQEIVETNNLVPASAEKQGQLKSNNQFPYIGLSKLKDSENPESLINLNKTLTEKINENTDVYVLTGFQTKENVNKQAERIFKSWIKFDKSGNALEDENNTFTPSAPFSSKVDAIVKNMEADRQAETFTGSYKFFIEKLHGRNSKGPYKKNKIKSTKGQPIPEELSNRMVFAAYIDNFYDDYSVSWSEYNFIGRGEGVPVYKSTKRSLTLAFDIISDHSTEYMLALEELQNKTNKKELNLSEELLKQILNKTTDWGMGYQGGVVSHTANGDRISNHIPGLISDTPEGLWTKMTFLAQCVYPYYRTDGKMKEQPFIRLRIADFFDVTGVIESISFELNELEGVQIDLNPSSLGNIPLFVKVNIKMTIYHDYEPSSNFYGFYHRKEFDKNEIDKVTGKNLKKGPNPSKPKNTLKNSPTSFMPMDIKENLLSLPEGFEDYYDSLKENLKSFKKNFQQIQSNGLKLKDTLFKEKLKSSIEDYNKVQAVAKQIQALRGEDALVNEEVGTSNKNQKKGVFSKENLNKINNTTKRLKDNLVDLYGDAQAIITDTADKIRRTNETLNKFGINLKVSEDINALVQKAKELKPTTFVPKTFGDIINKIGNK